VILRKPARGNLDSLHHFRSGSCTNVGVQRLVAINPPPGDFLRLQVIQTPSAMATGFQGSTMCSRGLDCSWTWIRMDGFFGGRHPGKPCFPWSSAGFSPRARSGAKRRAARPGRLQGNRPGPRRAHPGEKPARQGQQLLLLPARPRGRRAGKTDCMIQSLYV